MTRRRLGTPLLALVLELQLGVPALASAESWPAGDVAAADELQREESTRAAAYRKRVAQGDVRAASAPRSRSAPEAKRRAANEEPRDAADWFERLERWLEEIEQEGGSASEAAEATGAKEAAADEADDWWAEEERRLERAR